MNRPVIFYRGVCKDIIPSNEELIGKY